VSVVATVRSQKERGVLSGVYKRCGCRDRATGRQLGASCPGLRRRGHGSWSFCLDLPRGAGRKRRQIRRSGFATQQAAWEAREFLRNPSDIERAAEVVTSGSGCGGGSITWRICGSRPFAVTARMPACT
jgi:hypothetical protein